MDISYFLDLKDGRISELLICSVSSTTASMLGLKTPHIYLKTAELNHILRHVDIFQLRHLPDMISNGLLVKETLRPDSFLAIYQHEPHRYKIAMKIASNGREVWISTMHRTNPKQTTAILNRASIIRRHR